jgi:hypothetical protein
MMRPRRVGAAYAPPPVAAPPRSSGKRKRPAAGGLYRRLLDRQLDAAVQQSFTRRSANERFSHLGSRLCVDIHAAPAGQELSSNQITDMVLGHGTHPAPHGYRIIELCAAGGLVFGLTENGICTAFDGSTGRRVCVVNDTHEEVVRSIFYNRRNSTLMTVSVFAHDNYSSLHCRAVPLAALWAGRLEEAVDLFETESLSWPGFVEFDDVNAKILTFSADNRRYSVWSMGEPTSIL